MLQGICTTVTVALETALQYQQSKQSQLSYSTSALSRCAPLSEQLSGLLDNTRMILVGTERPLTTAITCIFLRTAEILSNILCIYCRLTYGSQSISLEAMISLSESTPSEGEGHSEKIILAFGDLVFAASCLGGTLQIHTGANQKRFRWC